ncbi:MAG: TolB family protein [Fimbriimonadales bacterium]
MRGQGGRKLAGVDNVARSPNGKWLAVLRLNPKLKAAYEKPDRGDFRPFDVWLYDKQLRPIRKLATDSWYTNFEWLDNNRLRLEQVGPEGYDGDGYSLYHYILNVSTGMCTRLPSGKQVHGLAISPNGRYIAESEEPGELYVRDLKGKGRRTIDKDTYSMKLMWSLSGRWLYFQKMSSKPKDDQQLWRLDTKNWKIEQLSNQPEMYALFHFDREHGTVFFRNGDLKLSMSNDQYRVLPLCSANLLDSISIHWK